MCLQLHPTLPAEGTLARPPRLPTVRYLYLWEYSSQTATSGVSGFEAAWSILSERMAARGSCHVTLRNEDPTVGTSVLYLGYLPSSPLPAARELSPPTVGTSVLYLGYLPSSPLPAARELSPPPHSHRCRFAVAAEPPLIRSSSLVLLHTRAVDDLLDLAA